MKTALLIDLDGTLVDSVPDLQAALNGMLSEIGRPALDREAVTAMVGDGTARLVERGLKASGGLIDLEAPLARFTELYRANPSTLTQVYPGVRETLRRFREEGLSLAVVTNKPARPTRQVLEGTGLAEFFSVVVAGDTLPSKKPDPAPLLFALEQLGRQISDAVMIGDHHNDLVSAAEAGMPSIFVRYGYERRMKDPVDPLRAIDRFDQIPEVLSRL